MKSEKKLIKRVSIRLGSEYFIAHSAQNGAHKIQSYPRCLKGILSFMEEIDEETEIGIEETEWTRDFIRVIGPTIKSCIILTSENIFKFTDK